MLNLKANEPDVPFSYYVAEFRSYGALARMVKGIRINKAQHQVMVMSGWHQYNITSIAHLLGIKMNVIDPEKKNNKSSVNLKIKLFEYLNLLKFINQSVF